MGKWYCESMHGGNEHDKDIRKKKWGNGGWEWVRVKQQWKLQHKRDEKEIKQFVGRHIAQTARKLD